MGKIIPFNRGIIIPKRVLADQVEEIRFRERKKKALAELADMTLHPKHVHFDGLIDHIVHRWHEDLDKDPDVRLAAEKHMEKCRKKFWENY